MMYNSIIIRAISLTSEEMFVSSPCIGSENMFQFYPIGFSGFASGMGDPFDLSCICNFYLDLSLQWYGPDFLHDFLTYCSVISLCFEWHGIAWACLMSFSTWHWVPCCCNYVQPLGVISLHGHEISLGSVSIANFIRIWLLLVIAACFLCALSGMALHGRVSYHHWCRVNMMF